MPKRRKKPAEKVRNLIIRNFSSKDAFDGDLFSILDLKLPTECYEVVESEKSTNVFYEWNKVYDVTLQDYQNQLALLQENSEHCDQSSGSEDGSDSVRDPETESSFESGSSRPDDDEDSTDAEEEEGQLEISLSTFKPYDVIQYRKMELNVQSCQPEMSVLKQAIVQEIIDSRLHLTDITSIQQPKKRRVSSVSTTLSTVLEPVIDEWVNYDELQDVTLISSHSLQD